MSENASGIPAGQLRGSTVCHGNDDRYERYTVCRAQGHRSGEVNRGLFAER